MGRMGRMGKVGMVGMVGVFTNVKKGKNRDIK